MGKTGNLNADEQRKFVDSPSRAEGTAVEVVVGNDASSPIPVTFDPTENVLPTLVDSGAVGAKKTHTFQDNLKQLIIRSQKAASVIKYNFIEADFDSGDKFEITSGGFLELSGLKWTGKSIFFETNVANDTIEILELY